jgi:hypothetical protein
VRRCDGTSGLGLDGDAGDVVGDRVVEVTRQLLALPSFGLLDVAGARVGVVADCSAQGCGEQKKANAATVPAGLIGSATWVMTIQTRMTPTPVAASRPAPHRNSA